MAGVGDGHNGGGPIWAIFDSDAVAREKWNPVAPNVDFDAGFFFSAGSCVRAREQNPACNTSACRCRPPISRTAVALQRVCRCRRGSGFCQAQAALQNRKAALLRGVVDARDSRHPGGTAHQWQMSGRGYEGEVIPDLIAAASRRAASPCMVWRAASARASSQGKMPTTNPPRPDGKATHCRAHLRPNDF